MFILHVITKIDLLIPISTKIIWIIEEEIASGSHIRVTVLIARINQKSSETSLSSKSTRKELTLNLRLAITVNRSQRQSDDNVGVCLSERNYNYWQLYTSFLKLMHLILLSNIFFKKLQKKVELRASQIYKINTSCKQLIKGIADLGPLQDFLD